VYKEALVLALLLSGQLTFTNTRNEGFMALQVGTDDRVEFSPSEKRKKGGTKKKRIRQVQTFNTATFGSTAWSTFP
jgi:hypothetical protein